LFQPLPWFVKLYMHTLSIELDGVAVSREVLDEMHFVPAEDRVRSSLLELQMVLPANASMLRLRLDFDKGFLRGFDLPPARFDAFRVIHADTRVPRTQQASAFLDKLRASSVAPETLYMNSLLLLLPTPDFSMTFNVAAMTGSVLSILFLSLMRAMTARESWKDYRR
jgi:phosphatidylinositol glycan class T